MASLSQFAAVGVGAALGAWIRWGLAALLNARLPIWPLGTLASNLIGGYLVGLAVAFFSTRPELSAEWRLFVITGFLGGLTTFSAFSAEVTLLLGRGDVAAGVGLAAIHLFGSLLLTAVGIASFRLMFA
jgi:CrcB protein